MSNTLSIYIRKLTRSYTLKADLAKAKENIDILDKLFADKIAKSSDIGYLLLAKARYVYMTGDYKKALEFVNKDIAESKQHGLKETSRLFSSTYIVKINALHKLKRPKEARKYVDLLKNMYLDSLENFRDNAIAYSKLAEQYI